MKIQRLVPTIALLVLAGHAAAQDGIAPVTSLETQDVLVNPVATVAALVGEDPPAALDLPTLQTRVFVYDSAATPAWGDATAGVTAAILGSTDTAAGIAIVGSAMTGGVSGTWQYRNGSAASWSNLDLSAIDEAGSGAFLLSLIAAGNAEQLRFVPEAYATGGTATLTFRIWDGSTGTPRTLASTSNTDPFAPQPFGGSPTAFSAETRTLTVQVVAANDAPTDVGSGPMTLISAIPRWVGDLLNSASAFSDPDYDTLGIAITDSDTVAAGWEFSTDYGGSWSTLTKPGSTQALVLTPSTLIRYMGSAAGGSGLLTVHAWDQTSGSLSGSLQPMDGSISANAVAVDVEANDDPTIESITGDHLAESTLQVRRGTTEYLYLYGSDPEYADGDVLAWAASSVGDSGAGVSIDGTTLTYTAPSSGSSDSIEITVSDLAGNQRSSTITVAITDNTNPTVAVTGQTALTMHLGDAPLAIGLTSTDAESDDLAWSYVASGYAYGSLVFGSGYSTDSTAAAAGNTATYTPSAVGSETVTFRVDDGYGGIGTTSVTIDVQAPLNSAPTITQITAGDFAILGQPFEAVVRATDVNTADIPGLTLVASETSGSPVTIVKLDDGQWRLRFVPTSSSGENVLAVTVTDHPGGLTGGDSLLLSYVTAPAAEALTVTLPTSTADRVVYGAIAPGSEASFAQLGGFLSSHLPSETRAFWWAGTGYAELPGSSPADALRNAAFFATTVPANLSFAPATQPAPFAITLPAGRWTFFGIPPLLLSPSGGNETTHPWSEIELQQTDGTAVDAATKLLAIGPEHGGSGDADTQPFDYHWDGSSAAYQRTDTLNSGTGYWIRNRSAQDYRLVRLAVSNRGLQAQSAVPRTARPAASADLPPAPPASSSSSSAAADGGGGSCGAGGLAGLLLAGLACLGLRRGRRN